MSGLSVVTFKWGNHPDLNTARHVNILRRMVERNYRGEHRFICVTDNAAGIDKDVEVVPLWDDFSGLQSPHGPRYPSCYRRLKLFSKEIEAIIGKRFVSLDLDCVITGDVTALWNRPENIVLWKGKTNPTTYYNGSMLLMTAGARPHVWEEFVPTLSPRKATNARQFGSDQGWISYRLGPHEAAWGNGDGVYSYKIHVARNRGGLPPNARIVFFNGKDCDPADNAAQRLPWVRDNWR